MITEPMSIVFLVAAFGLLWYIFRGLRSEDENPIWGTILAAGINFVICALLAIWFVQGNIVQIYMVSSDTHSIDFWNMSQADVFNITNSSTSYVNRLGEGGAGMYTVATVEEDNLGQYENLTVTRYYHHNLVYARIQDLFVGLFFAGVSIVSLAIFFWFGFVAWGEWQDQREFDRVNQMNPERDR